MTSLSQWKDLINNGPNVSGLEQAAYLAQLLTARLDNEVDEPYLGFAGRGGR
jgi:hypothetical protein